MFDIVIYLPKQLFCAEWKSQIKIQRLKVLSCCSTIFLFVLRPSVELYLYGKNPNELAITTQNNASDIHPLYGWQAYFNEQLIVIFGWKFEVNKWVQNNQYSQKYWGEFD